MNTSRFMMQFRKYGLGLIIAWTCILAAFLWFIIREYRYDTTKEATREARDYHELNLQYRRWSANIGGVYAPTDKVTPNPHLVVPDRDVTTESGKSLTLVNPAYMTRMVFEIILNESRKSKDPIINRLVSLKPLNPANTPNAWEEETLRLFEKKDISERSQVLTIGNKPYLQFMGAFTTEEGCLKCHAHQGYKVGDIRGGMSIAIPMSELLAIEREEEKSLFGAFALLWILGAVGIALSSRRRHQQEMDIVEKNEQLGEQSLKLEEEISERQLIQEQLEEQNIRLEEESVERQQTVVTLQKTENFLQTIVETEPECVKLLDAECNLLLMNRAGLEMIDADTFDQVKGQDFTQLVSEPYRSAFAELNKKAFQGIPGSLEFETTGLRGRRLWLNSLAVPFRDENGAIVATLVITRNVTELKRTVDELQKKNAEMEQFIYTVSHDLRTPLVTVKTFLGYLDEDMIASDQERISQDMQFIHSAANKMKVMLDELLELSRVNHADTLPVMASLSEVLADALDALAGVIIERKADILLPDTDLMLFGTPSRLCQIWQNLIENALKYNRNDTVLVIELGVKQIDGETVFFVKDNGVGVDRQYHTKIFGLFEKLDPKSPGAGIGLHMIQRIIEKYGGRIWIESEGSGTGSCFCFTLPLALA